MLGFGTEQAARRGRHINCWARRASGRGGHASLQANQQPVWHACGIDLLTLAGPAVFHFLPTRLRFISSAAPLDASAHCGTLLAASIPLPRQQLPPGRSPPRVALLTRVGWTLIESRRLPDRGAVSCDKANQTEVVPVRTWQSPTWKQTLALLLTLPLTATASAPLPAVEPRTAAGQAEPLLPRTPAKVQTIEPRTPTPRVTRLEPRNRRPVRQIASAAPSRPAVETDVPLTTREFHAQFWEYLASSRSRYARWGTLPRQAAAAALDSPHGGELRLYANMVVRANPRLALHGSILVREEYDPRQDALRRVNVMYRARDYDQANFDWYWIEYLPDGSVASSGSSAPSRPAAGRVARCIACHRQAEGGDLLFSNDPDIAGEIHADQLLETLAAPLR